MVKRIANHLDNMRAFDKQVDDLNRRRPNGASALSRNTPALAKDLRLHDGRAVVAAAADKPGAAILAIMPPDPFIASEARTTSRNATAACYNQRQIADAEQRQREREERGQAEAKAAAEADRAAWGAKYGWPT